MTLTLGLILANAGIDTSQAIAIRHAYTSDPLGIHADSSDDEIIAYTSKQSVSPLRFAANPPRHWVVFLPDGGSEARLWAIIENRGEVRRDSTRRQFDLSPTSQMDELRNRLVIGWRSPRTWWVKGTTAAAYPVRSISDPEAVPFPGFDKLVVSHAQLQTVIREPRYASWTTALSSVKGVYLITDTKSGRHYVGKADGRENIYQRWRAYSATGHGGNAELLDLDPTAFRYSLLRVFDPSTPETEINTAEDHYKLALASRAPHGLNRN